MDWNRGCQGLNCSELCLKSGVSKQFCLWFKAVLLWNEVDFALVSLHLLLESEGGIDCLFSSNFLYMFSSIYLLLCMFCHFRQFCFFTLVFLSVIWLFVFHLRYIILCHVVFCSFSSPLSEPFPASLVPQTMGRGSQNTVSYSAQFFPRQKLTDANLAIGCPSLLHFLFHSLLALYSSPSVLSLCC